MQKHALFLRNWDVISWSEVFWKTFQKRGHRRWRYIYNNCTCYLDISCHTLRDYSCNYCRISLLNLISARSQAWADTKRASKMANGWSTNTCRAFNKKITYCKRYYLGKLDFGMFLKHMFRNKIPKTLIDFMGVMMVVVNNSLTRPYLLARGGIDGTLKFPWWLVYHLFSYKHTHLFNTRDVFLLWTCLSQGNHFHTTVWLCCRIQSWGHWTKTNHKPWEWELHFPSHFPAKQSCPFFLPCVSPMLLMFLFLVSMFSWWLRFTKQHSSWWFFTNPFWKNMIVNMDESSPISRVKTKNRWSFTT